MHLARLEARVALDAVLDAAAAAPARPGARPSPCAASSSASPTPCRCSRERAPRAALLARSGRGAAASGRGGLRIGGHLPRGEALRRRELRPDGRRGRRLRRARWLEREHDQHELGDRPPGDGRSCARSPTRSSSAPAPSAARARTSGRPAASHPRRRTPSTSCAPAFAGPAVDVRRCTSSRRRAPSIPRTSPSPSPRHGYRW